MQEILNHICNVLKIEAPTIVYDDDSRHFPTQTTVATLEIHSKVIYINRNFLPKTQLDFILTLAHECRHLWQWTTKNFDPIGYKTSETLSLSEYNMQIEEIDAHAFACAYLIKYYHVKPLFQGLDNKIKQTIYNRAKRIKV